jgi:hypothetical protein
VSEEETTEGAVRVASFTTPLDAELARTLLEQHDIEARIEGDMLAGAALHLQSAFGGVRVMVPAADAVRARELIDAHERELAAERRGSDSADAQATRACALALVGWLICPFLAQLISLYQLLRIPWSKLGAKGRRRYVIGLCVDALILAPIAYSLLSESGVEDAWFLLERIPPAKLLPQAP